jgi:hypothetical protein
LQIEGKIRESYLSYVLVHQVRRNAFAVEHEYNKEDLQVSCHTGRIEVTTEERKVVILAVLAVGGGGEVWEKCKSWQKACSSLLILVSKKWLNCI